MAKKSTSKLKTCTVGPHKNCVELTSGNMRLAITTEVGPRIIGCYIGEKSKTNQFAVLPAKATHDNGFILYGGHRLWHAPEEYPTSYEPDNKPVLVTETESGVEFSIPADPLTKISRSILVEPLCGGFFMVTHTLTNCGIWPVEIAPWALSMMAPGGTAIIPQGTNKEGYPFYPDRQLNYWAYTSMRDSRIELGDEYIFFKNDPKANTSAKIGYNDCQGWIAYVNNGVALVKYFDVNEDGEYPDNGCSVESYTCSKFHEIETLGALETLEPGESVQHVEYWQGIDGLPEIKSDEDVEKYLMPLLLPADTGCCCEDDDCGCDEDDFLYEDECGCGHCHCEDGECDCGDDCHCHCHCEEEEAVKEAPAKKSGKSASKKKSGCKSKAKSKK